VVLKRVGKLEGMVALITGGDSGIGRSVAVLYARGGLTSLLPISTSMKMPRTRSAPACSSLGTPAIAHVGMT
jgi:hypothetical protein